MSDTDALQGERHAETPTSARRISRRHTVIGIGAVAVLVAGFFAFRHGGSSEEGSSVEQTPRISSMVAFEPAKVQPASMQQPVAQPQPMKQALMGEAAAQEDPLTKARTSPLVLGNQPQTQHQRPPMAQVASGEATQPESELSAKLHATVLEGSKATLLPHPEMTITMGTLIPCTLVTAVDSSAPGIVTCITQQDVLGTTGSVVLMERGTRIVGEYSSRMSQGQSRMFVIWNRAETPRHVVIVLGSPAADAIGRAGFDGAIDTHFWQRFGGALLVTMIDGAFSTATSLASKSGSTSINLDTGDSVATEALRNSINIPPTLRKNQGETVAVMAARDLDFADVYGLAMRVSH